MTTRTQMRTVMECSLFKGSRNPPLEKLILLRTRRGDWGLGTAFKHGSNVYFDFARPGQSWWGEPKGSFTAWMSLPVG